VSPAGAAALRPEGDATPPARPAATNARAQAAPLLRQDRWTGVLSIAVAALSVAAGFRGAERLAAALLTASGALLGFSISALIANRHR